MITDEERVKKTHTDEKNNKEERHSRVVALALALALVESGRGASLQVHNIPEITAAHAC
jgi:hypothetical protein